MERRRRQAAAETPVPAAFDFPESTLGPEQRRWLELLETGQLPEPDPAAVPGEWMIQPEWRELLERSLDNAANRHWFSLLHLGVMRIEAFDEAGAEAAWEESLRLRPSAWAWRNLGALALRRGEAAAALPHYQRAWELAAQTVPDVSFAQERLAAALAAGKPDLGWEFWQSLAPALQAVDAVRLLAAKLAFARDDLAFVESALEGNYASLREGARDLTDLWYAFQVRREQLRTGQPLDAAQRRELEKRCPPPPRLDFRIID